MRIGFARRPVIPPPHSLHYEPCPGGGLSVAVAVPTPDRELPSDLQRSAHPARSVREAEIGHNPGTEEVRSVLVFRRLPARRLERRKNGARNPGTGGENEEQSAVAWKSPSAEDLARPGLLWAWRSH